MATGLKRTSSDFFISAEVTTSVANTFTSATISLPLTSLDREVFVITGIIFDPATPDRVPAATSSTSIQLTRQVATGMLNLNDFNLIGKASEAILGGAAEFNWFSTSYGNMIVESGQDYIDVVATPNMFIGTNTGGAAGLVTSSVRVYGYRAKADVSVYSALIASELNA